MDTYSVDEAFELLKIYKITSHKESERRWLRSGPLHAGSACGIALEKFAGKRSARRDGAF